MKRIIVKDKRVKKCECGAKLYRTPKGDLYCTKCKYDNKKGVFPLEWKTLKHIGKENDKNV